MIRDMVGYSPNQSIDYAEVIKRFPWLVQKDQKCILSPDIDGLLCGLLMTHYLNWQVVGFYEGRNLLLKSNVATKDCIFLDMEILRPHIRSVGHHMNVHMLHSPPADYLEKMQNCLNPNLLRGFDRCRNFSRKYPLGTIHLLMYILENRFPKKVTLKPEGLAAIFFADGVWKILFNYTKNVLDWFQYLHSGLEADWWKKLKVLSTLDLIKMIDMFLGRLNTPILGKKWYGHIPLSPFDKDLFATVTTLLSEMTGWNFEQEKWKIQELRTYQFSKEIYGQGEVSSKSNATFLSIWDRNPLSLAMTEGAVIQYTVEAPDQLP